MFTIHFIANCPEGQGEVDPESLDCAAYLIEEAIGLLLVELFGGVLVEEMSVTFSPPENARRNTLSPAA
jgi:hypothetical protein